MLPRSEGAAGLSPENRRSVMAETQPVSGARPLSEWANIFRGPEGPARRALAEIYGHERSVLREKAAFVLEALDTFARTFRPDASVFLVRSAGRINLIGMHIDHRCGPVNPIAVRETWFICEPREDDLLDCATRRSNLFPRRNFSISRELGEKPIADWDSWTLDLAAKRKAAGTAGDWINYIKSAALYLEHIRPTLSPPVGRPLRGINLLVAGTIPLGAGLSSSSSLVVGAADALIHRNSLPISDHQLVDICGQAEWFVGTRGGAGDHAAIKFGRRGHVSHLGSHPLTVDAVPLPDENLRVVLCNSRVEAKKSAGARDEFNNRIAAYEFGLMLLKKNFPDHAPVMQRLRDVNPDTLGVGEAEILRMLLRLPERMSREQVLAALPEEEPRIRHIFSSHAEPPAGYPVRNVCAFGIAECLRSRLAAQALRNGKTDRFAEVINISHDGDRVTRLAPDGRRVPLDKSLGDEVLLRRIADLESGDPDRVESARLWRLPGGYDASIPEIDAIVDSCLATDRVLAARIVGAGLGGAAHAIVHKDAVADLVANVTRDYYEPRNLEPDAEVYAPVGGAGVFLA